MLVPSLDELASAQELMGTTLALEPELLAVYSQQECWCWHGLTIMCLASKLVICAVPNQQIVKVNVYKLIFYPPMHPNSQERGLMQCYIKSNSNSQASY